MPLSLHFIESKNTDLESDLLLTNESLAFCENTKNHTKVELDEQIDMYEKKEKELVDSNTKVARYTSIIEEYADGRVNH